NGNHAIYLKNKKINYCIQKSTTIDLTASHPCQRCRWWAVIPQWWSDVSRREHGQAWSPRSSSVTGRAVRST
ncbi:hypothetical protein THAOC_33285, partial [Thalassiosira oceanica]